MTLQQLFRPRLLPLFLLFIFPLLPFVFHLLSLSFGSIDPLIQAVLYISIHPSIYPSFHPHPSIYPSFHPHPSSHPLSTYRNLSLSCLPQVPLAHSSSHRKYNEHGRVT